MLELRTLGTLDLRDGPAGAELRAILAQSKRIGLLCYLALARPHGFHRRDKLLALFWPESDTEHARASLRQAVRFLRRSLGEAAVESRGDDELALGTGVLTCDAVEFEQALTAGEAERALALYQGDLLPGFYVDGAPQFEEWLEAERTRLCERAVAGAWAIADARERAHDAAAAAEWGRRAVALAPTDDVALRRLMQLLERLGDPDGALAAYHEGVRRLRAEYEIEPSPETIQLGEEICDRVRATAAALRARAGTAANGVAGLSEVPARRLALGPVVDAGATDQTPPPRRLVPRRRWLVAAGLLLVAVLGAGGWLWLRQRRASDLDPRRVVVAVFENETGDSTFKSLGLFAADYITQGLAGSDFATPIDARGLPGVWRGSASSPQVVRRLALENGAGTVVRGRYYLVADSIRFDARITDARDGRLLHDVEPVAIPRSSVESGVELLRSHVLAALAASLAPWFTSWELRSKDRAPSYAAYREYAAGLDAFAAHSEWIAAAAAFERAAKLDTTFYAPRIWAALSRLMAAWGCQTEGWGCAGPARAETPRQLALADSLADEIERRRGRLNQYDRYFFDWYLAYRRDNVEAAYVAATRMVESAPGSLSAQKELAYAAVRDRRPREALRLLERLNPEHRRAPELLPGYWSAYLDCAAYAGEYEVELEHARIAQRLFPGLDVYVRHELMALVALGRVAEAERLVEQKRDILVGFDLFWIGLELRAHRHPAASRRVLLRALAWTRAQPAVEPALGRINIQDFGERNPVRPALSLQADILYTLGREAEARPLYEQIVRTDSPAYVQRGFLGAIAAHAGDRATARRIYAGLLADTSVAARRNRDLNEARADVAAALGERDAAVLHASRMDLGIFFWLLSPEFDPLRGYPPFETLLRPKG